MRKICFEGQSGLVTLRPEWADRWNRNEMRWTTPIGTFFGYSSEVPDKLRGPEHHVAWVDELASYDDPTAVLDLLLPGLRLGERPRLIVTTTPRPVAALRALLAEAGTVVARGSTYDNAANLPAAMLERMRRRYEGTTLGRQELYGEILEDVEGALWKRSMLLHVPQPPSLARIVVAVDPSGSENGDEVGIVVCGLGFDDRWYVLADYSGQMSPDAWATRIVQAFDKHQADRVVAETNYGAKLVETVIRTKRRDIPFTEVHATRGKRRRAEPIAALYEQGRVSHVRGLHQLEDELCTWSENDTKSPGRMDALVWGLTNLSQSMPNAQSRDEWADLAGSGWER